MLPNLYKGYWTGIRAGFSDSHNVSALYFCTWACESLKTKVGWVWVCESCKTKDGWVMVVHRDNAKKYSRLDFLSFLFRLKIHFTIFSGHFGNFGPLCCTMKGRKKKNVICLVLFMTHDNYPANVRSSTLQNQVTEIIPMNSPGSK